MPICGPKQLARRPEVSPQASEETLRAFDAAIALDPNYANAYRGRGAARIDYAFNAAIAPTEVRRLTDIGIADARKAVELAPALGAAHSVIGNALAGQADFAGAAAEFDKGLALSPGDARTYKDSAGFIAAMGRFEDAITRAKRAVELDPLNPETHESLAYVYYWARRYQDSITAGQRSLELEPGRSRSLGWQGFAYVGLGNYEAARTRLHRGADPVGEAHLPCDRLRQAGQARGRPGALAQLIKVYGDAGELPADRGVCGPGRRAERARHARAGAYGRRSGAAIVRRSTRSSTRLRNDPRYKALIAQLKFPTERGSPEPEPRAA